MSSFSLLLKSVDIVLLHRGAPISRHHFMTKIYNHFYPHNLMKMDLEPSDAHLLGVLFITLALGILSDPNSPMLSTEAEKYHQLARAA